MYTIKRRTGLRLGVLPPLARDIMPAMASFTEDEEADLSCCAGMGLRETV